MEREKRERGRGSGETVQVGKEEKRRGGCFAIRIWELDRKGGRAIMSAVIAGFFASACRRRITFDDAPTVTDHHHRSCRLRSPTIKTWPRSLLHLFSFRGIKNFFFNRAGHAIKSCLPQRAMLQTEILRFTLSNKFLNSWDVRDHSLLLLYCSCSAYEKSR